MTNEKKIDLIAEVLELGVDEFTTSTILEEVPTWDSVAVLSVISIMNDEFKKFPKASEVLAYKTVGELMSAMC